MSSIPRAAKIQALHDIGAKIDDGLEQAKIQTARRDGTRTGHSEAISHILSNCKDPGLDKNTVQHCVKVLQQLQTQSNALYYMTLGAEKQCAAHVAEIKKMYDLEVVLKMREETLPAQEEIASRPVPPRTLKEMRLAEAAHEDNNAAVSQANPSESKEPESKEPEFVQQPPEKSDIKNSSKSNRKKKQSPEPLQSESPSDPAPAQKKEIRKKRKVKSSK